MTDTHSEQAGVDLAKAARTGTPTSRTAFGLYLLLSLLVLGYVALLTGNRSEKLDADAWEHHRAVRVMSQNLIHPGNPTYDTDEPSIRYSPYTVALALVAIVTDINAYDVLSGAAVFNTLLFLIALWVWLRAYGLQNAAPSALLCILFLYGYPPGYANSLALSDLPWHQVNPSAMVMPIMMLCWAWLACIKRKGLILFTPVATMLIAFGLLSHGMSAAMGGLGMLITAFCADRNERLLKLACVLIVGLLGLAIAITWPWYDLLYALTHTPDKWYWFNPAILKLMLLTWCLPAILLVLVTLPMRDQGFIRTCLLATLAMLMVAAIGAAMKSPSLARLPLAGLIFPQAAVGVFIDQSAALNPRSWQKRIRNLFDRDRAVMYPSLIEAGVVAALIALALPNALLSLDQPHLARKWFAPLLHKENKQTDIRNTYQALLGPYIHEGDVVLAQPFTGWPVPSFGGRLVYALHMEFFTPDQADRLHHVQQFFTPHQSLAVREEILDRYHVAWILLDRENMDSTLLHELLISKAVVSDDGRYVLLDAGKWKKASDTDKLNPYSDS